MRLFYRKKTVGARVAEADWQTLKQMHMVLETRNTCELVSGPQLFIHWSS